MRYARAVASIRCGQDTLTIWIVVRADIPPADFTPIPEEMTDDDVRKLYGVRIIYELEDSPTIH